MSTKVGDFDGMRNTWFSAVIEHRAGITPRRPSLWAVELDVYGEPTGCSYQVKRSSAVPGIAYVTLRSFINE